MQELMKGVQGLTLLEVIIGLCLTQIMIISVISVQASLLGKTNKATEVLHDISAQTNQLANNQSQCNRTLITPIETLANCRITTPNKSYNNNLKFIY